MFRTVFLILFAGLVALPAASGAADLDERFGVGIEGGFMKLVWGDRDYSNVDQFVGFRLRHGLSSHWTLDLGLKYGYIRPGVEQQGEDAGLTTKSGAPFYTTMLHPTAGAHYRFAPQSRITPYVGAAVGVLDWRVRDHTGDNDVPLFPDGPYAEGYDTSGRMQRLKSTDITASAILGCEFFFNENFAADLGVRYHQLIGSDADNVGLSSIWGADHVDANTALVEAFLGLTVYFGSADSDGDGIANNKDACPDDPEDFDGYADTDGCPDPDNDGDGILDAADDCPDEAEDVDGFQDADGCPDPDNDGDGIADAADRCPDEAEDVDGFQDADGCPDPDNDGDGVPDAADSCPETPVGVAVDETGCPKAVEIKASLVLEGVEFESSKAVLTPNSKSTLNEVAESLAAYPEVKIEIGGYTDSTGPAELNRELSQRRAEAVRQYLIEQGIAPERLIAVGYGEDQPIASNETREGRAQNRRVELKRLD
jgi:outer membrane protein OmpA-like peptidoglycan-associated protein/opacity protein-like surface antigen